MECMGGRRCVKSVRKKEKGRSETDLYEGKHFTGGGADILFHIFNKPFNLVYFTYPHRPGGVQVTSCVSLCSPRSPLPHGGRI